MQQASLHDPSPSARGGPRLVTRLAPQSIAAQLILLTALALGVMLFLGGAIFVGRQRLEAVTQQAIVLYDETQLIDSIYTTNLQIAQDLDALLSGAGDSLIPVVLAQNEDLTTAFASYRATAEQYGLEGDIAFTIENEPLVMQIRQDVDAALNHYRAGDRAEAQAMVDQIDQNILHLASAVERSGSQRQLALAEQKARRNALQQQQILLMPAIFLFGALLLAGTSFFIARSIDTDLRRLSASAALLANGDYAHRVAVGGSREIAHLATAFNHMAASVQERQQQVQQHQETIAHRADELEHTLTALRQTISERDALTSAIREIANPVLPVAPGTLVMPLIGMIDSERAAQLNSSLLSAIEHYRARIIILDMTGLPLIDTHVARALLAATAAARLLGTEVVLVGVRPELAQIIVGLGIDLESMITLADLQSGIRYALKQMA